MKRLAHVLFIIFAVLFVNVSFAGNSPSPLLSKDFNNDFEKVIKENPKGYQNVLKLGFPKEFLDSTVNITSIGDFNSMNQNNINVEYVPMITVRHMLYALCNTDQKKGGWNVQPIYCCRNELGFTLKAGSKAPVIGFFFTYPRGGETNIGYHMYADGQINKMNEAERMLAGKSLHKMILVAIFGDKVVNQSYK